MIMAYNHPNLAHGLGSFIVISIQTVLNLLISKGQILERMKKREG